MQVGLGVVRVVVGPAEGRDGKSSFLTCKAVLACTYIVSPNLALWLTREVQTVLISLVVHTFSTRVWLEFYHITAVSSSMRPRVSLRGVPSLISCWLMFLHSSSVHPGWNDARVHTGAQKRTCLRTTSGM